MTAASPQAPETKLPSPKLLQQCSLWLLGTSTRHEEPTLGFGHVQAGHSDELLAEWGSAGKGATATTYHLLLDTTRLSLDQLPLAAFAAAAFSEPALAGDFLPLEGVRLAGCGPSFGPSWSPSWRLSAELTLELAAEVAAQSGFPDATLVSAGLRAVTASSYDQLAKELKSFLECSPKQPEGCVKSLRGYPLPSFAEGNSYADSRPAVFLDRDGIINVDTGYGHRPEDFSFVPGVVEFLKALQADGWPLVIITNQAGVAKGKFSMKVAEDYHSYVVSRLADEGIEILASELCPFHKDGSVEDYRKASILRKPQPGMALRLASRHNLRLEGSVMIGDKDSDRLRLQGMTPYIVQGRYDLDPELSHYTSFADILAAIRAAQG